MLYVNKNLRIHFLLGQPVAFLVSKNKDYKISFFIVFILCFIKNNEIKDIDSLIFNLKEKYNLEIFRDDIYDLLEKELVLVLDKKDESNNYWFSNNWEEGLFYLMSNKDFPFIDYDTQKGFIEDKKIMKKYLSNLDIPDIKNYYPDSNKNIHLKEYSINYTLFDIYNNNQIKINLNIQEKVSFLLKTAFGFIGENDLGFGKFPKKVVPSGGSRHPSEGYLFDFSGIFSKDTIYYYDPEKNFLMYNNRFDGLIEKVNSFSYNYLKQIDFLPRFGIAITSNFIRNMWRYRESRTYRVMYNDVGHIVSILNLLIKIFGFYSAEYSFIDEQKFLETVGEGDGTVGVTEKPIYFILFK
ncbi:hypothetical protein D8B46_09235 [Candidatus Gracilibacteria bacterium]|nr:MAG: hypothetical protein D8B46_09235 [Candidatus Gracilibacteria bacterium]